MGAEKDQVAPKTEPARVPAWVPESDTRELIAALADTEDRLRVQDDQAHRRRLQRRQETIVAELSRRRQL